MDLSQKQQTFKDKYIPMILGLIGIVLCAVWVIAISQLITIQDIAIFCAIRNFVSIE